MISQQLTAIVATCDTNVVESSLEIYASPRPEILTRPPISQNLAALIGLVEVAVNPCSNPKVSSRRLGAFKRPEIPARIAALVVWWINRVVDSDAFDSHKSAQV